MLYSLILFLWSTSKLLQGEICQSLINNMTQPIMQNMPVVAMAFNIPVSCVRSLQALFYSWRTNTILVLQAFLLCTVYGVLD